MSGWREHVRRVEPYVPGEQPKGTVIKLNTNENPYPPAPGVTSILRSLDTDQFRKYPDPKAEKLVDVLAKRYGRKPEEVFVGVGSDDVLGMAFLTFFNGDQPILFPDITYSFYDVWAELFQIPYRQIPLDENLQIVCADYLTENGGIVIANPNAPTSIALPVSAIEEIIQKNPDSVVIVDEAYVDFGAESVLPLVDRYDNLLVVQTFSKSRSMAGMRIGYAIGNAELIRAMQDVKYSYNSYTMNETAIACGVAAVEDEAYFQETCSKIMETRAWAAEALKKLGFTMPESSSNFLFVRHEKASAEWLQQKLKERKIYVRYFKKPRIDQYLRITIGTREEMETLLSALEELLAE